MTGKVSYTITIPEDKTKETMRWFLECFVSWRPDPLTITAESDITGMIIVPHQTHEKFVKGMEQMGYHIHYTDPISEMSREILRQIQETSITKTPAAPDDPINIHKFFEEEEDAD